jgi:membrane protein YqaA with SNARE-associated domain
LHAIKEFFARFSGWIWHVLQPLGPWGVFAIAAVDGSLVGMPVDAIVAGYVLYYRNLTWLYVLMASAGSALGSLVIYGIGYEGGETLLRKRMSAERFARIKQKFDDHEFLALMLPAILPPPSPFKLFVLAAAAFEMNIRRFLLAIFLGRVVRFSILSFLVLYFGPQIMSVITDLFHHHRWETIGVVVAIGVAFLVMILRRNGREKAPNTEGSEAKEVS